MPIIINGGSRSAGAWWAKHLGNMEKNERVELVEFRGLTAENMPDAFREMYAVSRGTKCSNYFYQANINPRADEHLTPQQWVEAVDTLERNLGLTDQPRFVIEHEKNGRTHRHIVWSRIDAEKMVAISDSLTAVIHERTSRELEIKFDLERGKSILVPDRDFDRPDRRPKNWETFRGGETGLDPNAIKAELTELWRESDNGQSFKAAIEERGYILAWGDRRVFVVVDQLGDDHSLARRLEGVNTAQVRERLAGIDKTQLPSVAEAKEIQADRAVNRDDIQWEEELAKAAIAKEEREKNLVPEEKAVLRISEALVKRDLAYHEKQASLPMTTIEKRIANAVELASEGYRITDTLSEFGITLVRATMEDVKQLSQERAVAFATDEERYIPRVRAGELVAVNDRGEVWTINPHRIDVDHTAVIAASDGPLLSVAQVRASLQPEREAGPYISTTLLRSAEDPGRLDLDPSPDKTVDRMGAALMKPAVDMIDGISKILSGEGEPNPELMTPEQRAAYSAELARQAETREANQPTEAEIEWREAVAKVQRAEAEWELGREQREKERDHERWRGRERERER